MTLESDTEKNSEVFFQSRTTFNSFIKYYTNNTWTWIDFYTKKKDQICVFHTAEQTLHRTQPATQSNNKKLSCTVLNRNDLQNFWKLLQYSIWGLSRMIPCY